MERYLGVAYGFSNYNPSAWSPDIRSALLRDEEETARNLAGEGASSGNQTWIFGDSSNQLVKRSLAL